MFEGLFDEKDQIPFIRELYSDADEEVIRQAEQNYVRFLELSWQIFQETGFEPPDDADSPNFQSLV